jgi:hypothetical protein
MKSSLELALHMLDERKDDVESTVIDKELRMNFCKALAASGCIFAAVALQANADTITYTATDLNAIGQNVNVAQPYSGVFDLTSAGFYGSVLGHFSFSFDSDGTGWKPFAVAITIQGANFGPVPYPNGPGPVIWNLDIPVFGPTVNYTITDTEFENQFHNFKIVGATLTATGDGGTVPGVPDGGTTLILLGAGLSALGLLRSSLKR